MKTHTSSNSFSVLSPASVSAASPIEIRPAIPSDFQKGLADIEADRVVEIERAHREKPETNLDRLILWIVIGFVIALVLLGSGCGSLIPTERNKGAALTTADNINSQQALTIQKAVAGSPPPNVTISGTNNTTYVSPGVRIPDAHWQGVKSEDLPALPAGYAETVTVTSGTKQAAGSSSESSWFDAIKIPLGVKIALLAFGLALLFAVLAGAVWFAKRNSAAAAAAFGAADSYFARRIEAVSAKAALETDKSRQAELLAEAQLLEKERGKLGRK